MQGLASQVAETTIARTIIEGSGGPDNTQMSDAGLRFIRHLLSISSSSRQGSIPNFKNMETVQDTAREFIRISGSAAAALKIMYIVTQA